MKGTITMLCIAATGLLACSERDTVGARAVGLTAGPEADPAAEVPDQRTFAAAEPIGPKPSPGTGSECPASEAGCDDGDGDGVPARYDCDDADPRLGPFAVEQYCDGVDQNCNGFDECDRDGDGVISEHDCDDADPSRTTECRPGYDPEPYEPML